MTGSRAGWSIGYGIAIVVVWMLAWGSLSVANALSGTAVAVAMRWFTRAPRQQATVPKLRPVAALELMVYIGGQVLVSNVTLARQVLMPVGQLRPGVVAVPLPPMSDSVLTLVVNVLGLSPGTMPLSTSNGDDVMYVHVLHLADPEASRRQVLRLVELATAAFGEAT